MLFKWPNVPSAGTEYMYVSIIIIYLARIDAIFTFLCVLSLAFLLLFDAIAIASIVRLNVSQFWGREGRYKFQGPVTNYGEGAKKTGGEGGE